jgi:diguanylate cyclase (GGDEF)-like protein
MTPVDPDHAPYRICVRLLALVVIAAAAAVVGVGWGLNVAAVRMVVPGAVAMEVQTAVGLGAAAGALLLLGPGVGGARRGAGLALSTIPGMLGIAVLLEYLLRRKLGIDELPFVDSEGRAAGMPHPGRFTPTVAVCFLVVTAALLMLDRGTKWRWRPSELLALPILIAPTMSLIGYAYSITAFYGPASAAKLAVNTALCFLALAVALLLARPRGRVLELATTTSPAGIIVRRMVPICVVVPLVLGWLHLRTVEAGVFNFAAGTWWMTAAVIAAMAGMIRWCAGTLSRTDGRRRAFENQLYALANRDSLTGLFNRHRFEEELDQVLARARRYGGAASILVIDLDHMKPVNDSFGHAAGDDLLRGVAAVFGARLREADIAARLGGDEFAVVLIEAGRAAAAKVARELCCAIAEIRIETPYGTGSTTASVGVAPVDGTPGLVPGELLARADEAMYRAKRAGGNQVASTRYVSEQSAPALAPATARELRPRQRTPTRS